MKPKIGMYILVIDDISMPSNSRTIGKITRFSYNSIWMNVIRWGDGMSTKVDNEYYVNMDKDTYIVANTLDELFIELL